MAVEGSPTTIAKRGRGLILTNVVALSLPTVQDSLINHRIIGKGKLTKKKKVYLKEREKRNNSLPL